MEFDGFCIKLTCLYQFCDDWYYARVSYIVTTSVPAKQVFLTQIIEKGIDIIQSIYNTHKHIASRVGHQIKNPQRILTDEL